MKAEESWSHEDWQIPSEGIYLRLVYPYVLNNSLALQSLGYSEFLSDYHVTSYHAPHVPHHAAHHAASRRITDPVEITSLIPSDVLLKQEKFHLKKSIGVEKENGFYSISNKEKSEFYVCNEFTMELLEDVLPNPDVRDEESRKLIALLSVLEIVEVN